MPFSNLSHGQAAIRGNPPVTPERFGEMLRARRTVNFFQPEPVPRQLLLEAVEVARWAPNHRLTEPWHFYLLGEEMTERIRRLIVDLKAGNENEAARDRVWSRLKAIPSWFVLTCRLSPDKPVQEREDYAACACAVQNLMLYLWQAGIGVKWTSGQVIRDERFYRLLGIEAETESVVGLFWCGRPAHEPRPQKRRDIEAICTEIP